MNWYLAEVANVELADIPDDRRELGGIYAAYQAIAQMTRDMWREVNGDDDETTTAEDMIVRSHDTEWGKVLSIVAVTDNVPRPTRLGRVGLPLIDRDTELTAEQVIGRALPWVRLKEYTDRLDLGWGLYVRPQWRRQGVGTALLKAAEDWGRQEGRHEVASGSSHELGSGADALRPNQGELAIAPDGGTAFALTHGYRLAQTERHSVQDISPANLETARANATVHEDYELRTFVDDTPDELRAAVIQLHVDMVDAPTGEMSAEPEVWDEARLQDFEENIRRTSQSITTIAIRKSDGKAGGYSLLVRHFSNPQVVYQWDTVVNRAHRGHGLGLSLKATNLLAAAQQWPEAERVHTWNASENDHMWRVNQKLGYRTASVEAVWQKQL